MSYTTTDLQNVQSAILALAKGERIVKVTIGDQSIEYGQSQIKDLRTLRNEIKAELAEEAAEIEQR